MNPVNLPAIVGAIAKTLDAFEDGVFNEAELAEVLGDLTHDLSSAVDRRILFLDHLGTRSTAKAPGTGLIGRYEELYRTYREAAERAECLKERIRESTMLTMQTLPDYKFIGSMGKLAVQANSSASLICDLKLGERSIRNLIEPDSPEFHLVPQKYLKEVTVYQLDTEALRADLAAGEEHPWARLERGSHLRVRR